MRLYRGLKHRLYPFENRAELLIQINQGNTGNYGLAAFNLGNMTSTPTGNAVPTYSGSLVLFTTLANLYQSIAGAGASPVSYSSVTEYTNLFDEYRIDEWTLDIMYNSNNSSLTSGQSLPIFYIAEDPDSTDAVSSPATMFQYAGMKTLNFGNSSGSGNGHQYFTVKNPTVQLSGLTTAGTQYVSTRRSPWLSTSQSGTEHIGIKMYYDNPTLNAAANAAQYVGYLTIVSRIRFSCRSTK